MDLAAGTYVIFIRDAQDCETNVIVEIDPGVNLNALVEPVYECTDILPENYVNITLEDPYGSWFCNVCFRFNRPGRYAIES